MPAEPASQRLDPADPQASVPAVRYRSTFADYRGWREMKVADWRAANDLVDRIGGWRVYAREAQQSDYSPDDRSPTKPIAPDPAAPEEKKPAQPAARGRSEHAH